MIRDCYRSLLVLAPVVFAPAIASAHHSGARFDRDAVLVLDGIVLEYEWRNPHVYLTVEDAQGTQWSIETDSTPILTRSGWTRNTFVAGDSVSARVQPSQTTGDRHTRLISVQTAGGQVLDSLNQAGRDNETVVTRASTLAGIWTSDRSQTFSFLAAMANHPLTDKARTASEAFDQKAGGVVDCVAWPTPFFMTSNYWYLNQVELFDDRIVIRSEFYDAERIIYTDGRWHPDDGERTVQGHSIGWWEGETLVVDTRLFSDHRSPIAVNGIPSGSEKHVTERLTLINDGSNIRIDIHMEDPEFLAEPLSTQFFWTHAPNLEMISAPCDPDSARRFLQGD